jgi:hypothetical protein
MEAKTKQEIVKKPEIIGWEETTNEKGVKMATLPIKIWEQAYEYIEYADQQCKAKDERIKILNERSKKQNEGYADMVHMYLAEKKKADELAKALNGCVDLINGELEIAVVSDSDRSIVDYYKNTVLDAKKALESHKSNTPKEQPESREVCNCKYVQRTDGRFQCMYCGSIEIEAFRPI